MSADAPAEPVAEACDLNLGPRQRQRRLVTGYVASGVSLVLAVLLLVVDAPRAARLALFPPLVVAALGFLQYRAKT